MLVLSCIIALLAVSLVLMMALAYCFNQDKIELEIRFTRLRHECSGLEGEVTELQEERDELKTENQLLKSKHSEVDRQRRQLQESVDELKEENAYLRPLLYDRLPKIPGSVHLGQTKISHSNEYRADDRIEYSHLILTIPLCSSPLATAKGSLIGCWMYSPAR